MWLDDYPDIKVVEFKASQPGAPTFNFLTITILYTGTA